MDVKKIFIVLVTIVACVMLGALVLNILLPNVTTSLITAAEGMIYNATGMSFDFNGDGVKGSGSGGSEVEHYVDSDGAGEVTGNVDGFEGA